MGRGRYPTHRTQQQVHDLFNGLVGRPDDRPTIVDRTFAMPYNGSTFGAEPADRRSPESSYYSKEYNEALGTARALAKIGLDSLVADIRTSDRPDVVVEWRDGTRTYVEHTIAGDRDTVSYPRHLEDASIAFRRRATTDPVLSAALADGLLTAKLADPGLAERARPAELAAELDAIRDLWLPDAAPLRLRGPVAPSMQRYNAQIFYRTGRVRTGGLIFQIQGGVVTRSHSTPHVLHAVERKCRVAAGYDAARRPLWLIVAVASHASVDITGFDRREIVAALKATRSIAPFERLIVELNDLPPIVRDGDARQSA